MSDTTLSVELPGEVYDRFEAVTSEADVDQDVLVATLIRDHVMLAESISKYVDGDHTELEAPSSSADQFDLGPPIAHLLGFEVVAVEPGEAEISFAAGPRHANPMGTLHGGVYCDIGDAAMGIALASTLDADESFTTLELDAKYSKPVWDADLTASGTVRKRGRRTAVLECTITDESDSLVASLTSVCLILQGEEAAGR